MRKIAIRGLLARKVRLALTAFAVALGVTLIAGTYIFTDTINKSFDNIFVQSNKGTDVALSPNNDLSGDEDPPPIPGSVLQKVQQVDGVAQAEGSVFSAGGSFRKADGSKLKGKGFNAIAGAHDVQRFESFAPTDGHLPQTADEVAIPKGTADDQRLQGRRQDRDRRRGAQEALHDLGHRDDLGRRLLRRRRDRGADAARGPAHDRTR